MYIYISSEQSDNYFQDNTSVAFRIKLPRRLRLSPRGQWSIAVLDIDLPRLSDDYKSNYLFIHCNSCEPSVYNSSLSPILNRLYFYQFSKGKPVTFDTPRYVPLTIDSMDTIDIYLTDSDGNSPSFKPGHVACTLHITQNH